MASERASRTWKAAAAAAAFVVLAALIWAAGHYRDVVLSRRPPAPEGETAATAAATSADIYFADAEYTELVAERREVAAAATPEERIRLVVTALIAGPREAALSPTLPADAKLLSVFRRDRVALLNFDEHIRSKRFGSTGELFAVNSLYRTVTANVEDVDGVIILVDGRMSQTLAGEGGHVAAGFPLYGELGRYVSPPPEAGGK